MSGYTALIICFAFVVWIAIAYRMGYTKGQHKARMSILDVLIALKSDMRGMPEEVIRKVYEIRIKIVDDLQEVWHKQDGCTKE